MKKRTNNRVLSSPQQPNTIAIQNRRKWAIASKYLKGLTSIIHGISLRILLGNGYHSIAQRRSYHKKLLHIKQRYDNQNTCQHVQWGHTTRSAHQPMGHKQQSDTPTKPGWTKKIYLMMAKSLPRTPFFRQQWLQTHQQDQTTRPIQAEQPRCNEPTSTSGPLIRRRVIIYVEDHTRPGQATDRQTIPHIPKDTMKVTPHK